MTKKDRVRKELDRQKVNASRARSIILVVVVVAVAVYIVGCLFYSRHFYEKGTVFGISMRNKTAGKLDKKIDEKIDGYKLNITTLDGEETISGSQVDLCFDDGKDINALLKRQNAFAWVSMFAEPAKDYGIDVSLDTSLLGDAVRSLSCMQEENMTPPTDAHLEFKDDEFVVCPATNGNTLEYKTVYDAVLKAIRGGETAISLEDLSCYLTADVEEGTEALDKECEQVNRFIGEEITYDFGDRQMTVDPSLIASWIKFEDDFKFSLDEDAVADYVYDMAYDTDTLGLTRVFTTHSGEEVTLQGGDYGWCIDKEATTEQLIGLIEDGKSVTVEPVYLYTALCRDTDDIGSDYVEISIAAQHMWVYRDGECIVDTPVVTGNPSEGNGTPSDGVWAVDARTTDYTLTGQGYNSEVNYWLPFNGNVGIHDASWRSSFGDSIYRSNGSHGCINTPPSVMGTVYENVQIGYPVVVY